MMILILYFKIMITAGMLKDVREALAVCKDHGN